MHANYRSCARATLKVFFDAFADDPSVRTAPPARSIATAPAMIWIGVGASPQPATVEPRAIIEARAGGTARHGHEGRSGGADT